MYIYRGTFGSHTHTLTHTHTQDEDVLNAMSLQSSSAGSSSSSSSSFSLLLHYYYVVPCHWMRRAWPLLSGALPDTEQAREQIGPMELGVVVLQQQQQRGSSSSSTVQDPISDEEEEDVTDGRLGRQQRNNNTTTLDRQARIGRDFFLVGPNAWLLLHSKFGGCQELPKQCAWVLLDEQQQQQTRPQLVVVLHDANQHEAAVCIPIPPTGRFSYDSVVDDDDDHAAAAKGKPSLDDQPSRNHINLGNVSDDETDDLVRGTGVLFSCFGWVYL
jgi:hypothetical protein